MPEERFGEAVCPHAGEINSYAARLNLSRDAGNGGEEICRIGEAAASEALYDLQPYCEDIVRC